MISKYLRANPMPLPMGEQPACLCDQPFRVLNGDGWRFLRQSLINHHDECRELAQPLERLVIQHQVECIVPWW